MDQFGVIAAHFGAFADAVTLDFSFAQPSMDVLSATLGFPPDQLKIILVLFAAFPLGLLHAHVPGGARGRHATSTLLGIALAQFVYGSGWAHSLVCSLASYALVLLNPRAAPPRVICLLMAYLSAAHVLRMRDDYMGYKLDFTGPQMLLTIKLSSFAYNIADGLPSLPAAEGGAKAAKSDVHPKVLARRRARALAAPPSLLEFMGYVYCFGTFFVGPAFEISEYLEATERRRHATRHATTAAKAGGDSGGGGGGGGGSDDGALLPAHRLPAVARKFATGAAFLGLFAAFSGGYDAAALAAPAQLAAPWHARYWHAWCAVHVTRWRYYAGWYIAEAACVLMGFGFVSAASANAKGKKAACWDGVRNVAAAHVDLPESPKSLVDHWNICTQQWLQHYVYARSGNSLVTTYVTSAFWHGFYPGYYLFFLSMPLLTKVNRLCYRRVSPRFARPDGSFPAWYGCACTAATSVVLNWLVLPFFVLSFDASVAVWKSYYFAGHLALALALAVLPMLPTAAPKKED